MIEPRDRIIGCRCGSEAPAWSAGQLVNWVDRPAPWWRFWNRANSKQATISGCILACQTCGEVHAYGPQGRFERKANALPMTPRVPDALAEKIKPGEPLTNPQMRMKERP